jgi:excisionase family DNA binding protein
VEKETLTVPEAAAVLGIGVNKTYSACQQGLIPALRIGNRWIIPRTALLRMLENVEQR